MTKNSTALRQIEVCGVKVVGNKLMLLGRRDLCYASNSDQRRDAEVCAYLKFSFAFETRQWFFHLLSMV
jgi:hypothetical protein